MYTWIDTEPPVVIITSPENNTVFAEPDITVSGYITDNIGIVSVGSSHSWEGQGSGGGGSIDPVTNFSFAWNFTLVEGANERIQLEALIARLALLK